MENERAVLETRIKAAEAALPPGHPDLEVIEFPPGYRRSTRLAVRMLCGDPRPKPAPAPPPQPPAAAPAARAPEKTWWEREIPDRDIREALLLKAGARFFTDADEVTAEIEKLTHINDDVFAEHGISVKGGETLSTHILKLYVHGVANVIAKRMLAMHDELAARIAELEQARTMRFCGPFDPATHYGAGAVVQKGGAVYVSLVPTNEAPGASNHWRRIAGSDR